MFGIGGDDKDQLKENMEEIKQMVNNSSPGQQTPQDQENQIDELEKEFSQGFSGQNSIEAGSPAPQSSDNTQSFSSEEQPVQEDSTESADASFEEKFETDNSPDTGQQSFDNQSNSQPEPVSQQEQPSQNDNQSASQSNSPQQPGKDVQTFDSAPQQNQQPQQQPTDQNQSQTERSSQTSSTGSRLNESIPEPAETKDINVPEIDKGPLFIRRQKFESAKNMIQEMRYLSREIEEVVNQLERGIEEDRATEKEAKELLHSLEQDRSSVKKIISQQNKQQE